jgi:N4-gp56 family major capsid protein
MAYSPATNLTTSAGLPHVQVTYYKKKALDRLQKKFLFRNACMSDMIPKQEGRTVQWFRYFNLSANTTPSAEGTVGTGISPTSRVVSATVSQYTAFLTISDFLADTAIDPLVENHADLLGYQAGLSVDTITRNVIDAESSSTNQTLLGSYFRVADLRNARHALQAIDVQPMDDGNFYCILHPYVSYDLVNDPAASGLADIFKYNTNVKDSPLVQYEDRGTITTVAGCKVVESTNVYTQSAPNKYRVYIFGKDGIGCVDLAGRGPSKVTDPKKQRFAVKVIRPDASVADPEGVISAAVSYNFIFTAVVLDGPAGIGGVYRYKTLDAQSSIA